MRFRIGQPIVAYISQILGALDIRLVHHVLQSHYRCQILCHFGLMVADDLEQCVRLRHNARVEDVANAVPQIRNVLVFLQQILVSLAIGEMGFVAAAENFDGFVCILHCIVQSISLIDHIEFQLFRLLRLAPQHVRHVRPLIVQIDSAFVRHKDPVVMVGDFADVLQQQCGLFIGDRQVHMVISRAESIDCVNALLNVILEASDFVEELLGVVPQ